MLVTPALLVLIAIALAGGVWIAVRYLRLRRQINDYSRALRNDPQSTTPPDSSELQSMVSALHGMNSAFARKLSEQANEKDRLAAILEQMTDGVLIADGEGRVRMANPAARRFFQAPEAVGHSVAEVLRNHQLIETWRRCQQQGQLQTESVEIPGRRQWVQLVAIPDRHEAGSLLLIQDLTRIRRLETVRRDFVSNLSHELRTPLASLKALTESLQDGALSDPEAGPLFLDRIGKEVDALTQMVQELLDLARIESGEVALQLASVSAVELLTSAAERMRVQAERGGLTLRMDCADDLPHIRADRARLEQVLINLIHNAIKFTSPGGHVILSAQAVRAGETPHPIPSSDAVVRFAVSDTGLGIPADELPRVFERFYRVDKARSEGGTGLGLSIARHVVEAHGGAIWAESVEGRGSTFYFTIPIAGSAEVLG